MSSGAFPDHLHVFLPAGHRQEEVIMNIWKRYCETIHEIYAETETGIEKAKNFTLSEVNHSSSKKSRPICDLFSKFDQLRKASGWFHDFRLIKSCQ